jgi:hypothetical protein
MSPWGRIYLGNAELSEDGLFQGYEWYDTVVNLFPETKTYHYLCAIHMMSR